MPAYRSAAEKEIRDAVVAYIREHRPNARIIHEINAGSYGTRIDVLAVERAELIAFEIKSERDKLDRLQDQMQGMKGVAHHAFAVIHEKFLVERETNQWAAHYERDGLFYKRGLPEPFQWSRRVWVYPRKERAARPDYDDLARWHFPDPTLNTALPAAALDMLWRDELYELCQMMGIKVPPRTPMAPMLQQLRWRCTGEQLTRGICTLLRARRCIEADPEIIERIAA